MRYVPQREPLRSLHIPAEMTSKGSGFGEKDFEDMTGADRAMEVKTFNTPEACAL